MPIHLAAMVPPGGTSDGVTVRSIAGTVRGPLAQIEATKASPHGVPATSQMPSPRVGWVAFAVVGKSNESV